MNSRTLRDAHVAWSGLPADGKSQIKGLAGRLRATGLQATLAWVETKGGATGGQALSAAIRKGADLPADLRDLEDNPAYLMALGRAADFVDALHLLDRIAAQTGG